MKHKQYEITAYGEPCTIGVDLKVLSGALTFTVNGEAYRLDGKAFSFLLGRREQFIVGEGHLAALVIRPFGGIRLFVEGKYL